MINVLNYIMVEQSAEDMRKEGAEDSQEQCNFIFKSEIESEIEGKILISAQKNWQNLCDEIRKKYPNKNDYYCVFKWIDMNNDDKENIFDESQKEVKDEIKSSLNTLVKESEVNSASKIKIYDVSINIELIHMKRLNLQVFCQETKKPEFQKKIDELVSKANERCRRTPNVKYNTSYVTIRREDEAEFVIIIADETFMEDFVKSECIDKNPHSDRLLLHCNTPAAKNYLKLYKSKISRIFDKITTLTNKDLSTK